MKNISGTGGEILTTTSPHPAFLGTSIFLTCSNCSKDLGGGRSTSSLLSVGGGEIFWGPITADPSKSIPCSSQGRKSSVKNAKNDNLKMKITLVVADFFFLLRSSLWQN